MSDRTKRRHTRLIYRTFRSSTTRIDDYLEEKGNRFLSEASGMFSSWRNSTNAAITAASLPLRDRKFAIRIKMRGVAARKKNFCTSVKNNRVENKRTPIHIAILFLQMPYIHLRVSVFSFNVFLVHLPSPHFHGTKRSSSMRESN